MLLAKKNAIEVIIPQKHLALEKRYIRDCPAVTLFQSPTFLTAQVYKKRLFE
jgi:hypothetical protein